MKAPTSPRGDILRGSVTSTKFVRAAFALVEVLIIVAAIALHLAIICMVLALPILRLKPASVLPLVKSTSPQIARDLTTLAARTH
jgi:hypothetical protein